MKHPFSLALTLSMTAHLAVGAGAYWLPTFARPTTPPRWGTTRIEISRHPPLDATRHRWTPTPPNPAGPLERPEVPPEWLKPPPLPPIPRPTPQPLPTDSVVTVPVPRPVPERAATISSPAVLDNPPPVYPDIARRRGYEGRVVLLVSVSAEGRPTSISVLVSSGHLVLDEAAREAVMKWTFQPATRGGRPVEGEVEIPVRFQLEGLPA